MAFLINDRVRETTATTGSSDFVLQGATAGFESFVAGIGDGNTTYYAALDAATGAWEVGVGTYTALTDTLSRDAVLSSSNNDLPVSFAAGTKTVWCTQPASRAVYIDDSGDVAFGSAASIPNALLANDTITINGVPIALGGSGTFALDTLTIGAGLTGGAYNGAGPVTIALDTTQVLVPGDIGVQVQAFDPTLLTSADIGVSVQPYNANTLLSSAIGTTVQAWSDDLDDIAALTPSVGQYLVWDGSGWSLSSPSGSFLTAADLGVTVQAYDANTAKLDVAQTFSAPQRGAVTTDNDLSFDLNVTNNFSCTPVSGGALTFTNIASATGQTGVIKLVNGANYTITAGANTKITTDSLTTISATGTYLMSYFCDGTNVYVSTSGDLT